MASPCRYGNECRIDDVEAVRRAGGPIALGYPVAEPIHFPRAQLPAAPAVTTGFGENIPSTGGSRTDRRQGITLAGLVGYIVFMLVVALLIAFAYLHKPRRLDVDFQVRDFTVSNFSISDRGVVLAASWEANLTLAKPDIRFRFDLTNIYSFIYYRHATWLLSLSEVDPVHLEHSSNASLTIRNYAIGSVTQDAVVMEDIHQELRGTGTVTFGLGIHFKEERSYHRDIVTVYCKGLSVAFRFSGDIGFGALSVPPNDPSSEVSCRTSICGKINNDDPYLHRDHDLLEDGTLYC